MNDEKRPEKNEFEPKSGDPASGNGPVQIATTDPAVERTAENQVRWQTQPISRISTDVAEPVGTSPVFLTSPDPVIVETDSTNRGETTRKRPKTTDRARHHDPEAADDDEAQASTTGWGALIGALVVGLLLGIGGAWAYGHFFGSDQDQDRNDSGSSASKQKPSSGKSDSSSNGTSSSGASDIAGFGSPDEARDLHTKLEEVSERIDRLKMRIDRLKPGDSTPPAGLSTLQIRVRELSREVDDVAYLPERIRRMENELKDLKQKIRLQDEGEDSGDVMRPPTLRETPPPASPTTRHADQTTTGPRPDEPVVIDLAQTSSALEQGLRLFEQGRPVVALDIFHSLQVKEPDDARVWYLAALAAGDATEDWNGEARHLVDRGLALERADSPSTARIDRTLERLRERDVRGMDWLDAYRRQVVFRD
ncbi:MAG TPA: hypothetical protein VFT74_09140 [Isosphaeraceae bacterium]|nr:hypothetical protein [Isosphaeraceae bacterium]